MEAYNDVQVKSFQTFSGPGLFKVSTFARIQQWLLTLHAYMCLIVIMMFQISWTLTPQADTIIGSVLNPKAPQSLIELADSGNGLLQPWAQKYFKAGRPLANIVIVDHFEVTNVTAVAAVSSTLSFPKW